jgi:hypothetical protein
MPLEFAATGLAHKISRPNLDGLMGQVRSFLA